MNLSSLKIEKYLLLILIGTVVFTQNSCSDILGPAPPEIQSGIKSVIPAQGPLGARININGRGFGNEGEGVQIYFNDSRASIEMVRDTLIRTRVPSDARSGKISVIVEGDTLVGPPFKVDSTKTLFLNIKKISPTSGTPGDSVRITGTGFNSVKAQNRIFFNDILADVSSASDTLLKTVVPAKAETGRISIVVGQDTARGPVFTVDALAPVINSIEPQRGIVGTKVIIKGGNFSPIPSENKIYFNGTAAKVGSATETQLITSVPDGATSGIVKVTVGRKSVKGPGFTVISEGTVQINIATTGENVDPNGYLLTVGEREDIRTKTKDTITQSRLKAGKYQIELADIASNCALSADASNPRSVKIIAGKVITTGFNIHCGKGNIPPTASFEFTCKNLDCKFDGSTSSDADGEVAAYKWAWGDGSTSEGVTASHSYKESRTYTVKLVVVDKEKATASTSQKITVAVPQVKSLSPSSGRRGTEVVITGSGFSAHKSNNKITFSSGSGEVVAPIKSAAENQMVVDVPGDATTGPVYVSTFGYKVKGPVFSVKINESPSASFTYVCQNLSCKLDGSGSSDSDGTIESYAWNYGEYGSGTGATTSHHYEVPGTYTVMLTVSDDKGATDSISKKVSVTLPEITGISPDIGKPGTEVAISGSGFSADKSNNKVTFSSGSVEIEAPIKSATENQLVIDVPGDATTGPVYVATHGYKVSGPEFTVSQPKTLNVQIQTEGTRQDSDGYKLLVEGEEERFIKSNDNITYDDLYGDEVQVSLTGAASNCRVQGENPRMVALDNSDNAGFTSFTIDCTRDLRGKIVFTSTRDGNQELYIQNGDGSGTERLTNTSENERFPAISPDGLQIAYVVQFAGKYIYVMDSDGSDARQITKSAWNSDPSWSPDGNKLVIRRSSNSDAQSDIFSVDLNSGELQNITNTPTDREDNPDWSPDGKRLVYGVYKDGDSELFTISPDGSGKTQLTDNDISDVEAEWSPDGSKIAFVRNLPETNRKVHIMNADGSGVYELTHQFSQERSPSWSPDGSKMVYMVYSEGAFQIFIYSVEFNDIISTSYTSSDDLWPHWNYK